VRFLTEFEAAFTVPKVFGGHTVEWGSELAKSFENCMAIWNARPYKEVKIVGCAWTRMDAKSIPADEKVLDPVLIKDLDQVFEVLGEHPNLLSESSTPLQSAPR
jgi:hypothetical protein